MTDTATQVLDPQAVFDGVPTGLWIGGESVPATGGAAAACPAPRVAGRPAPEGETPPADADAGAWPVSGRAGDGPKIRGGSTRDP